MKPLLFAAAFSTIAVAVAVANSGTFSTFTPSLSGISTGGPRYTTEDERLVSEIAGSILNIAAFADHFEPGDPFQVRNIGARAGGTERFSLARRAEVFTVELRDHVWRPASYLRLASSFMADGADAIVTGDPFRDGADVTALLDAAPDGLRVQNDRLSRLLAAHPRSAALHERAALLLAAAARHEAVADRRPLLCRMTAHLAVARALGGPAATAEGQRAERLLQAFAEAEHGDGAAPVALDLRSIDGPATFGDTPQLSILPPL